MYPLPHMTCMYPLCVTFLEKQNEKRAIDAGKMFRDAADGMGFLTDNLFSNPFQTALTSGEGQTKKKKTAEPAARCDGCRAIRPTKAVTSRDVRVQAAAGARLCLACYDVLQDKVPHFEEIFAPAATPLTVLTTSNAWAEVPPP